MKLARWQRHLPSSAPLPCSARSCWRLSERCSPPPLIPRSRAGAEPGGGPGRSSGADPAAYWSAATVEAIRRLTPLELKHLATYTTENLHYGGNVRVKIWSPDGTILFSDAPSAIGRRFALGDDEEAVLQGRAASQADISDLSDPENATERGLAQRCLRSTPQFS